MPEPSRIDIGLAIKYICGAQQQLGALSDGQRRDLLKDNTPWSDEYIRQIVNTIRSFSPHI